MTTKAKKDYSQGKIYKIEPTVEHDEGDIYIGSTTKKYLSQRMTAHRSCYNLWRDGKHHFLTSYVLFDKYGIENCSIVLLENLHASNFDELASREAYHIKTLKCVNKHIPLRTDAEYYQDNKEKILSRVKEYRQENIEKIREYDKERSKTESRKIQKKLYAQEHTENAQVYMKQYYETNKEQLLKQHAKYRDDNKDKLREYFKEYAKNNKDKKREYDKQYRLKKKQEKESLGNV